MRTSQKPLSAVIIGCGKMGGGAEESWSIEGTFSHAAAYNKHSKFEVIAGVDCQQRNRDNFSKSWQAPHVFCSLENCIESGLKFDVASVCVPTSQHADILNKLLETDVLAVMCEKPLTDDYTSSKGIADQYQQRGKLLSVNYPKIYFEGVGALKKELDSKYWGEVKTIVGFYNKGIRNNGSHLVNLLQYLLGNIQINGVTKSREGFSPHDPTVDAFLQSESGVPIYLIGGDHKDFDLFEIQLIAEKGVVAIEQSGNRIRRRRTMPHPNATGYKALKAGEWWDEKIETGILPVINNFWDAISNDKALLTGGKQAAETDFICSNLAAASTAAGGKRLGE